MSRTQDLLEKKWSGGAEAPRSLAADTQPVAPQPSVGGSRTQRMLAQRNTTTQSDPAETHAQRVARRDDAGVRRSFAQRHPEMTGGEVGAARREMNTANVEWEAAKKEAAEAKDKTLQGKTRAVDRRRQGLSASAQREKTAADAAVKAGMPRRMAREMGLNAKAEMKERAQAQAVKEDAKRRKLDAEDAYGYAVKQAKTDALPTDVDELNALMATEREKISQAEGEISKLTAGGRVGRDRLTGEQQAEYRKQEEIKGQAERQLSLLVQRQYDQRNEQAFSGLGTDRQAAMGYLGASAAKEEAEKLNKVLLFLSNSSAYSAEDAQEIMGWQEELKEKYKLTDRDFADYAMGDVTTMLAVQEKIQAQVDQAAESMGEGYNFEDMYGYAKRQESKQEAAERAAAQSEWARKHPFLASVGSVAAVPFQAIDLLNMDLGKGKQGDPDYIPPDSSRMAVSSLVNTLRGTVSREWEVKTDWEIKGQNVASFLYQTGMSMADSAVSIAALGPGSVYLMGTNAAINGAKDIIDRGGTKEQALWGGLAAGAAEVVFEQVSVENLLTPKDITGWRSLVRETLKQGGIEASEEFCTEIANICSDTIIMGGNSNYAQALEQYKSQGMSEEQAQRKVLLDSLDQIIWAAAGGFVSGVGMGGGKAAMDYAGQQIYQGLGVDTQKTASTGETVNAAIDTDMGTHTPEQQAVIDEYRGSTPEGDGMTQVETREQELERGIAELDQQRLERGKEGLGIQGQATLAAMYLEGQKAGPYVQGMRELYAAGQAGVAMETVESEAVQSLNDHQRRAAYEAGQMDAKAQANSQAFGNLEDTKGVTGQDEELPFYFGSEEGAKSHEQAGELRLRDGGKRLDGAGAQGAVGSVAEGAGADTAGADRAGPADAGAGALQVGRAVSTHDLGIAGGVKSDSVRIVTGGETEAIRQIKAEAAQRGLEVVLFTGGDLHVQTVDQAGDPITVEARGYIAGNKVYIRADHAEHTAYQIWKHEEYHDMTFSGEADPMEAKKWVEEKLGEEDTARLEEAYSRALSGLEGVELWGEIAADLYAGMNMFARTGTAMEGKVEAMGELVRTQTDAQKAKSQTAKATDQRTGPPQGQQTAAEREPSGGKFSMEKESAGIYDYSKTFEEQLEDFEAGKIPKNDTLLVCGTPDIFQRIGLLSLPMTMNQTHIDYALNGTKDMDHSLGKEGLLQLPAALEHPIAIISSKTKTGTSLVAMLELRQNGKQVIVPVVIDGLGVQNGLRINSNALASVYGKKFSISRVLHNALENEANGVTFSTYYVDIGKATELFRGARDPMPKMPATSNGGFIHSITEAGSPVKPKFSDVTETQQFKRWFKGSKAVDSEGRPLVVYHGTATEFNTFQSSDGAYWFSEAVDYAEEMAHERGGERIVQAYLDMKNPYYATLEPGKFNDPAFERPIIQAARDGGYDGVILSADTDNELLADTFYIVFKPTQIKSATDNIGTFDREKPDIRFSQEPSDYIHELRVLQRENQELRKRVDYWMGQTRLSGGPTVDRGAVRAEASQLIKSLGVKGMTIDETAQRLQDIYDLISTGQKDGNELSYGAVREMAEDLARDVLSRAVEKDDSTYREYSAMRAYFKDTQLILSEADSRDFPDYGTWRKEQGSRMKLRKAKAGEMSNVDTVFKEAAGMWPEFFSEAETSAPSDQVQQIAQVLEWVSQITEVNPYSSYMEEAVQWTANDIIKAYGDLPMGKGTIADQWDAKVRQAQAEGREAVKQQRLVDDMYYGRKRAETIRWARERVDRVVAYEKGRTEKKIAEMKAWYAGRDAQAREYKKNSEARNRLLKLTQRLERMKTTTANKALIRELMGEIDTAARSLTGTKRLDLEQLRRDYQDYQDPNSSRYNPDFIPDARTEKTLERLSRTHIDDMTQRDVEDLTKALLNLEHEIRMSKRLLQEEENRTVYQLGQRIIDDMEAVQGSKASGVMGTLDKYLTGEVLSPLRMVRRMVGWRDSSPLLMATEALNKGQRVMLDYQMRSEKPFLRFAKDKAFVRDFSGERAKEVKIGGWTKDGLQEVTITPAMRASIYLHSLNPQNARHMAEGGVTVPDMKLYKKGDLAEAYARGTTVKIKPSDTQRLWREMSETERAFVREAQKYFRDTSQPELSRVAEILRGYAPTMVENYFPIVTNKNFMKQEITFDADGTATILKPGYMEERINASGPMMLQDLDSVVDHAIQQHGLFVGLAIPVRDFNKLWNVSTAGMTEDGEYYSYAGSVKEAVDQTWGNTGKRYIEKMVKDVQGRQHANDQWGSWMDRLRSNYAGAVLTLNASVAIKQAASYPTAAAVLGWKPLVQAMGNVGPVDLDLIAKYTPLQWYRSKGFASKELGDMARNNARLPKWVNWIQGMDLLTTRKLWKAAEFYVRDHQKALRIGSDAYYQAVAEVYNRVIEETQPNYTAMQRPQLLRSESDLMKNLAMFKTQPMQNLNLIYDAVGDFLAKRRQFKAGEIDAETMKRAGRNLGNAVTSQLVQAGVFAGMTLVWALFRGRTDKYKDKDKDEVTAEAMMQALGVDAGLNLVSGIPLIPELGEYFVKQVKGERGYALDVTSVSMVMDVVDAVAKLTKMAVKEFSGERDDNEKRARTLWEAVDVFSKGQGVPVENVANLFTAGYRQTMILSLGKYRGEYEAMKLTTDKDKYAKDYYNNLYKAMVNDRAAYQDIYEDMVKHGWDEAKIKKAMEDRMKAAQGVGSVADLEQRYLAPSAQTEYDGEMSALKKSKLWKGASSEQRATAKSAMYDYMDRAGGTKAAQKWDTLEAAGLSPAEWALYQLAKEMYDEPTESGKLGSWTNDELVRAIEAVPGLSEPEKRTLWLLAGKKEKSCPWG